MATMHKNVHSGNPLKADRAAAKAAAAAAQAQAKATRQATQLAAQQTKENNHLALINARNDQLAQARATRIAKQQARQAQRQAKVTNKTAALQQQQQAAIDAQTAANNAAMLNGTGAMSNSGDLIGAQQGDANMPAGTLADSGGATDTTGSADSSSAPSTGMSTTEKVLLVAGILGLAGYAYYRS